MDAKATKLLTYGLFVLTARQDEFDSGCIINTAMQVTTDPNRISITVNKSNHTHDMIMETKEFNVSIICQDAKFDLFKRFGFQSGRDAEKFDFDMEGYRRAENEIYYITKGINGFISGKVVKEIDLGTHTMFIADVTEEGVIKTEPPAVSYEYYQANIKPARKPKAEDTGKPIWVCKVCGYEYEGEEIPEDFICPTCKHPASDFEKVGE